MFIPYILPLMLGRTFDLDKMRIGVDIFPKEAIDNKQIYTESPYTSSDYGLVDRPDQSRDLVFGNNQIYCALSLKVKAGALNAGGAGEYLSDYFDRGNTVEMVIKGTYQRAIEYLPFDAKPIPSWKKYGKSLGTHYVQSIMYGGEIIAAVRFRTNSTKIKEMIKAPISHRLFDLGKKEDDEYIKNILKLVESTEIKVFSSIPRTKIPKDLDELKKTLSEFPKDLDQYNEGRGLPIKMELSPLERLDSTSDHKVKNRVPDWSVDLEWFEYKFDDLLQTKIAISDWMKRLEKPLTKEQEQKVGDFHNILEKTLGLFYDVIGKLDLSQGPDQLKKAEEAYGKDRGGRSFYKKYLRLRQEMNKDEEKESSKTT